MSSDSCLGHYVTCPICEAPVQQTGGTLTCANRHAFDLSRDGYVNFLAATGRASKITGDTREMLNERRAFLDKGHYQMVSDAVNRLVLDHLVARIGPGLERDHDSVGILDAGSGEGYYLGRLRAALSEAMPNQRICYFGTDVSKDAVRLTARQHPEIFAIVANTKANLPFTSIDVLLDIFSPRNPSEFRRIMAPGGLLVVVIPTSRHLEPARRDLGLIGIQEEKRQQVLDQFAGGFELESETPIEDELDLSGEDVRHLVRMGPNYWHLSPEASAKLDASGPMRIIASFDVLALRRASVVSSG